MQTGNLNGQGIAELQNYKFQNLQAAPTANLGEGRFYYNTVNHTLYIWNGTEWVNALVQGKTYTSGTGIDISGNVISADFSDLSSTNITDALGYTPYNSSNPSGYQANVIETIKVNNTTLTPTGKIVNISIPTTAADVGALADSTKYGATIDVSLNTTDYKLTITLKDQDGTALATKTVDFPVESVVVNGTYDSTNQKIVLTLVNGNTIDIPVGALISGLQTEITSSNKLDADLVDDTTSTNKFVTAANKTTWNNKQDAIPDLATIRTNAAKGATAAQVYTTTNPALTASGGLVNWTVTHNIGANVTVQVYETSSGAMVIPNNITLTSSTVAAVELLTTGNIAAGKYKVVVTGVA